MIIRRCCDRKITGKSSTALPDRKFRPSKKNLADTYADFTQVRRALGKLRKEHSEYLRRQDFLRYELEEISAAAPVPGEDEELTQRLRLLQNSEKIYGGLSGTYDILSERPLDHCIALLTEIADYDPSYAVCLESIQNCMYTLGRRLCGSEKIERRSHLRSGRNRPDSRAPGSAGPPQEKIRRNHRKVIEYRDAIAGELDVPGQYRRKSRS